MLDEDQTDEMSAASLPFLTARWVNLVVANYVVDPALLHGRAPPGTVVDAFEGRTFVSLVAFKFEDTRLFGAIPTPPSPTFEEVNLRFYVRRDMEGGPRRAVAFVREVVPSRLVAWVARTLYEEPYEQHRTESAALLHDPADPASGGRFSYGWESKLGRHSVAATTAGALSPLAPGSVEEFILEHYWGYTSRRDGTTSEYEVRHPPWRYWRVASYEQDPQIGAFYGEPFTSALASPHSVFVAAGSEVAVFSGHTLPVDGSVPGRRH
jgi:uncharacterized protein YqjF (DUF2071 family)